VIGERVPLKKRVSRGAYMFVLDLVAWVIVPAFISSYLAQNVPTVPLADLRFIYTFGAIIIGLQLLASLTEGMAFSAVFSSGSNLASAFYIWEAVNGGVLSVGAEGAHVTLEFTPLLFLLMLPSLFGAVRSPISFFLDRSEASRPALEMP
jgi:hypothetical protein